MSTNRTVRRCRPALETLNDRAIPATLVDLTTDGSQGTANAAIFQQCDAQPTGTGVIRSFLRVEATGVEEGYNTDARPLTLDENKSPQFTRSLTLGQVPVVQLDGVDYREFLLDINQQASVPLLSLDELRIYIGSTNTVSGYDAAAKTLGGLTSVFDMDGAGDVTVKLNYRLNAGSGAGDMFVLIPDSAVAGQGPSSFVYLYSKFGGSFGGNAGFEEWAVRSAPKDQPPPTQLSSISGFVFMDDNFNGLHDTGEFAFSGIVMQLQGTDDLGQTVVLNMPTDGNGFYQFSNLRPGTYSVFETAEPTGPSPGGFGLVDGTNYAGSLGGTVAERDSNNPLSIDGIIGIVVGAGQNGINYNFTEAEDRPN